LSERETHHVTRGKLMGFASLNPSYAPSEWQDAALRGL